MKKNNMKTPFRKVMNAPTVKEPGEKRKKIMPPSSGIMNYFTKGMKKNINDNVMSGGEGGIH